MSEASASILVISPDKRTMSRVRSALTGVGDVVACEDVATGLERLARDNHSLVILDWNSASVVGESLERAKAQASRTPRTILLVPDDDMPNALQWLGTQADDCVREPFDADELVARARASLQRPAVRVFNDHIVAGDISLDRAAHRVVVKDQTLELAPTEYRLLNFFVSHPGRVFSRQQLLEQVWTKNAGAGQRTVDVHVRRLRQAFEPFGCENLIQTVRGFGYRFAVPRENNFRNGSGATQGAALP